MKNQESNNNYYLRVYLIIILSVFFILITLKTNTSETKCKNKLLACQKISPIFKKKDELFQIQCLSHSIVFNNALWLNTKKYLNNEIKKENLDFSKFSGKKIDKNKLANIVLSDDVKLIVLYMKNNNIDLIIKYQDYERYSISHSFNDAKFYLNLKSSKSQSNLTNFDELIMTELDNWYMGTINSTSP